MNRAVTSFGKFLVRLGLSPRWFLEHIPYLGVTCLTVPDGHRIKLRSYGDDYLINSIYWTRTYEPESFSLFCRLAVRASGIFDVGSHVGTYALAAAVSNPRASVYAFEPLPEVYRRLDEHVALNGIRNLITFPLAAGRATGSADFYFSSAPTIPSNSTLRQESVVNHGTDYRSISVRVDSLDRVCQLHDIHHVDLVKIDTEGTELDVLEGFRMVLERDHPTLICEVLPGIGKCEALESLLHPLRYFIYRLEPSGPVPLDHIQTHSKWWNFLMTPMSPGEVARL